MDQAGELAGDQISMECEISCPELEVDSMSIDEVIALSDASEVVDVYEPAKVRALDAPPKRFYRTFWRSVVRRLLESQRAAVFASKKPTAS